MRLGRLVVVVAVLLGAHAAHASHCYDRTRVVGRSHCVRFGYWSHGATMWWEAGVVAVRFDPRPIDGVAYATHDGQTTTYHLVAAAGDQRPITAFGGRIRNGIGFGRHVYLASEADLAPITSGPALVADVSARGTTSTMTSTTGGLLAQTKLALGWHSYAGPISLAGELAPGLRIATYTTHDLPDTVKPPAQAWLLLEAHAKADAWLTPNLTLSIEASTDVLHASNLTFAILVGGHLMPYDGMR